AYTYDLRELVKTVSVGKTATDTDPKVTSYTYTDRGQKLKETKANDNTVDYAYYLDGASNAHDLWIGLRDGTRRAYLPE
ncbi:hypothetical protein ABZW51_29900, partial [Streptomyces cellulosae]